MNIIWAQNPLKSKIELNAMDIKLFRALYEKEHIEEALCSTFFSLQDGNIKRALARCTPYFMDGPDGKDRHREWMENAIKCYLESANDVHIGDCTCFAMSCSKCYLESLLGIDTIPGLGKHEAQMIEVAFEREPVCSNEIYTPTEPTVLPDRSCEEAISYMEANPPKVDKDKSWHDAHIERWKEEHIRAVDWLKQYKKEHLC